MSSTIVAIEMNSRFAGVRPIMDIKFLKSVEPSLLTIYGNVPLELQSNNSLHGGDQRSTLLQGVVSKRTVRNMVLIRYSQIKPPPNIMKERYRSLFTARQSAPEPNMQVEVVNVSAEVDEQEIIVKNYLGSQETNVKM